MFGHRQSPAVRRRTSSDFNGGGQSAAASDQQRVVAQRQGQIAHWLATDPHFGVHTVDGLHWIEPFRCSLVSVAFEGRAAIERWLLEHHDVWGQGRKSMRVLSCVRWFHWLRETIAREPRLRFFHPQHGQWLNPFNACWEPQVVREAATLNRAMLQAMAQVLVDCPQIQQVSGDPESRLLTREVLSARVAGDDPMATSELHIRPPQPLQRSPSQGLAAGIAIEDHRPFATQDLSSLSHELGSAAPLPPSDVYAHRWQVVIDGLEMAPIAWDRVQALVQAGRIQEHTMLRPEGGQRYFTAASLPSLLAPSRWSVVVDGLQTMPMTVQQLRELCQQGRLRADATLLPEGGGAAIRARDCPGLHSVGTITQPYPVAKPVDRRPQTKRAPQAPVAQVKGPGRGAQLARVANPRWLVQIKPNEQAVVDAAQLRHLARQRLISPQTMLRREDMDTAVSAGQVRGLF